MRPRNLDALAGDAFDILIVGGGIHGLATAYAAAGWGLTVALVEKGDFGGSTSFNHQRTAHGGLRSLQGGRFGHARESILERRALARLAPRLLRPLPFIVGTYRSVLKNRLALQAAFRIDRFLGRDRNQGIEPELHLPAAKLVSRAATLKLFHGIRPDGLTGGANWYDYQILHSNRLTIAFAEGADARGARLINHAAAIAAVREGSRIAGMRVRDALSGAEVDVRAAITINAAGAHAGDVMKMFGVDRGVPMLKAMNLVTSKPASDIALAAPARGAMLTLTPWHGRALVGTFQSAAFKQAADQRHRTAALQFTARRHFDGHPAAPYFGGGHFGNSGRRGHAHQPHGAPRERAHHRQHEHQHQDAHFHFAGASLAISLSATTEFAGMPERATSSGLRASTFTSAAR